MKDPRIKALAEAMHQALFSYAHPSHVLEAGRALVALLEQDPETYVHELAKVRSSLLVFEHTMAETVAQAKCK